MNIFNQSQFIEKITFGIDNTISHFINQLQNFRAISTILRYQQKPYNFNNMLEPNPLHQNSYLGTEAQLKQQNNLNPNPYNQQPPIYYAQNAQPPQPYPYPIQNQDINMANNNQAILPPNPNQNYFAACNEGISNGFGAMFFNMRDPTFRQTNVPIKQQSSLHISLFIFNLLFIAGLVVGVIGINSFLGIGGGIALILVPYVIYIIVSECCSDIREYLQNMKMFNDYQMTYNSMVKGRGYFMFWIQCYHYVTVRTKKGTSRRKVVTHTARERFNVAQSLDQSGQITSIQDTRSLIFLHYLKRFYFADDISQARFIAAYNNFVFRNTRDAYQNHSHTFDIEGFEEFVAFSALGENTKSLTLFHLFTILGFSSPYACLFERSVSRYSVGILKRLSV